MNKVNEYFALKEQFQKFRGQPIGNRIKKNGPLEKKIIEKFSSKRAGEILQRTSEYNFEEYDSIRNKLWNLKIELEEAGILNYNEEGEEIIKQL